MADARHDPEQQPLLSDHDPKRSTAGEFSHDSYVLQINEAEEWAQAYGNACYLAGLEAGRAATPSPPVAAVPATPVASPIGWALRNAVEVNSLWRQIARIRHDVEHEDHHYMAQWAYERGWADAAQPQPQPAQPLTETQVVALLCELNGAIYESASPTEMFSVIVRAVERLHGITAPPEVAP